MLRETLALAGFVVRHPIGRRRPLRCLFDTLRWQLTASSRPKVVPFVGLAKLWARRSETGVTGNIYVGLHEFADMAFVAHVLRPGDLFGDIGANAGSYTVLAGTVAGADVIAVEPVPETVERLRRNVELNGSNGRVEIRAVAVGDRTGTVRFTVDRDTINRIADDGSDDRGVVEVPIDTLDRIFAERVPLLLKIDVEGHEAAVLAGASHLLSDRRLKALIVEVGSGFDIRPQDELVRERLVAAGFEPAAYDPFRRSLTDSEGDGRRLRHNLLWVRDRSFLQERLHSAPSVAVKGLSI